MQYFCAMQGGKSGFMPSIIMLLPTQHSAKRRSQSGLYLGFILNPTPNIFLKTCN